jgi:hypothetical protein
MYCAKCGQENPAERTTCSNCGQPLMTPAEPPAMAAGAAASAPAGAAHTDGNAVTSLVLGLLSLVICCVTGVPAIILGHIARSNIQKSQGKLKGEGMALAGLILGYLSVGVFLILAAISIPGNLRNRISSNESSAVGSVRTINISEVTYASTFPKVGFSTSLEALGGPPPCAASSTTACLIDQTLASGQKAGYRFTYEGQDNNGDHVMDGYTVQAVPITPGTTGRRSFCSDESGVIRSTTSATCTRESPPLQ